MTSSSDMIRLGCFILGDHPWRSFRIHVSRDTGIYELPPIIQTAFRQAAGGDEVFSLTLFRVDSSKNELESNMTLSDSGPLFGLNFVEDYWPAGGQKIDPRRVHILVQGTIVSKPIPKPRAPSPSELTSVFSQLNTRQDSLAKNFQRCHSASTAAYPSDFASQQSKGEKPIFNGRPARRTKLPIHLYSPAFNVFDTELERSDEPTDSQCENVQALLIASQEIYKDESKRRKAIEGLLGDVIGKPIVQHTVPSCETGDLVRFFDATKIGRSAYGAILEVKNEIGAGHSDPSVQGAESYAIYWSQEQMALLRRASCCPSLIIAIAGPWMCVLGAVYLDEVLVQPLTDGYLWLGYHSQRDRALVRLTRIFGAISASLACLNDYYAGILTESHPLKDDFRFFPYVRQYKASDNTMVKFNYMNQMAQSNVVTAVFKAVTKVDRSIVVKFAESYNFQAHKLLAASSLAPKLLFHSERPMYGGLWMIVMELCGTSLHMYSGFSDLLESSPLIRQDITLALKLLHNENLVFGDLRPANILIVEDDNGDKRGRLVDFDWCGKEGIARYPASINPEISWAAGVQRRGLLSKQHDLEMLKKLFA